MILSYCRVSTVEQASDGTTSLAEQERKNRAIATLRGASSFDFANYVDSGISGSIPLRKRPSGARILADAGPSDIIVAAKLDRLFRSASDALQTVEDLAARKVDVILVDVGTEPLTSNGVSKLFFTMLSAFAEFERTRIAERMTDGRKAKKLLNGHIGGIAPYGFRVVGNGRLAKLEEDASEQEILALARDLLRGARPSYVCEELNRRGLRTRSGREFQVTQVQRMAQGG